MPNIELVSVDFTINDPDEGEGEEVMPEQEQEQEEQEQGEQTANTDENNPPADTPPAGAPSNLLSLVDIEHATGISYVTLCRYAQQYADELPSEGAGRKKRYYPEAVEVFKRKRAESTKGRKPASAQTQEQQVASTPAVGGQQATRPASPVSRRPGRPAGAGKKSAQKKVAGRAGKHTRAHGRMGARAEISSAAPVPVPASSASTLAMDRAVRELEIAQHVTRLEALKWGIAPVLVEIDRLEKLIAQAQVRGSGS